MLIIASIETTHTPELLYLLYVDWMMTCLLEHVYSNRQNTFQLLPNFFFFLFRLRCISWKEQQHPCWSDIIRGSSSNQTNSLFFFKGNTIFHEYPIAGSNSWQFFLLRKVQIAFHRGILRCDFDAKKFSPFNWRDVSTDLNQLDSCVCD